MSFSIDQAFDLLFRSGGDPEGHAFASRRWFRRPRLPDGPPEVPASDVEAADALLDGKVKAGTVAWAKKAEVVSPVRFDAERHVPPRMPYDVFAFAAHLVEQAGIYHHLQPVKMDPAGGVGPATPSPALRHIDITRLDRQIVTSAADAWAKLTIPQASMVDLAQQLTETATWKALEPLFESWWMVMGACGKELILARPNSADGPIVPVWWKHAWRLMAIADEAAAGTAFQFDTEELRRAANGEPTNTRWFGAEVLLEHALRVKAAVDASKSGPTAEAGDISTLSVANPALVNVLPKVRTASVGCTLRSLSHHLALLPASGVVKGRWTPNYMWPSPAGGSMPGGVMNLVLVPMPYSLGARSFKQALVEDVSGGEPGEAPRFGYFDVHQDWIKGVDPSKLTSFLDAIIDTAQRQSPSIHGFVFPELALDYHTFKLARDHVQSKLPETEIFVSGVSSNDKGQVGNFVAASTFPSGAPAEPREQRETVREKHHRWKLDKTQLRAYGLLGVLSPELSWWENIPLQSRQVDFTVIRRDSVLAAMICEDLARVDPCQQVIRAVGPNLVVALLMDAPQVSSRWPARYATVLAEDPGCAVLTLTSRGLMTLQHRLGTHPSKGDDRVVAMWRDDGASGPIELKCPYDAQAVLLTIVEQKVEDITLDGRRDRLAKAWRYVGDVPLRIPDARSHTEILGPEDLACWS